MTSEETTDDIIKQRLDELPLVVRNAITSASLETHLRDLASTQKLHIDQWQLLENEVMMTLLGFQRPEDFQQNIQARLGVTPEIAVSITSNVNSIVFEPIREELERQLEHPAAQEKEVSEIEEARTQQLGENNVTPPATITPATPPLPSSSIKVARPSESSSYKPGEPSSTRAVVHDDPYRVPPV